jgi:hypothetical protein
MIMPRGRDQPGSQGYGLSASRRITIACDMRPSMDASCKGLEIDPFSLFSIRP